MTVGELREKLDDLPDHAPVCLESVGGFTKAPLRRADTAALVEDMAQMVPIPIFRDPQPPERGELTVVLS